MHRFSNETNKNKPGPRKKRRWSVPPSLDFTRIQMNHQQVGCPTFVFSTNTWLSTSQRPPRPALLGPPPHRRRNRITRPDTGRRRQSHCWTQSALSHLLPPAPAHRDSHRDRSPARSPGSDEHERMRDEAAAPRPRSARRSARPPRPRPRLRPGGSQEAPVAAGGGRSAGPREGTRPPTPALGASLTCC